MGKRHRRGAKLDRSVYQSLALISQFGINMLVPIGMMSALGVWLDGRFHTSFWTILLFFAGALAGGRNVYGMAKRVYDTEADKRENSEEIK